MSYTLKLTNGKILLTLADQQSDSVTTSVTLIGKNVNAYGTALNDNFIRLLENFANSTAPTNPLEGQLWFNTVEQRLYVYNGFQQFRPASGPIISAVQPTNLVPGDLWIDTVAQQLKFISSDGNVYLTGSPYSAALGKSGWVVEQIQDNQGGTQTVANLYSNNSLMGILSNTAFIFAAPFPDSLGMTSVNVGFNVNNSGSSIGGIKWYGTATSADSIGGISANNVVYTNRLTQITVPMEVSNDSGIQIGTNNDIKLYVNTSTYTSSRVAAMFIEGTNEDFALELNSPSGRPGLYFDSTNERLGVFNSSPQTTLHVTGDATIDGNLTVNGTGTYVTTVDLRVDNKLIELAYSTATIVNDTFANGGGIVLHGYADKSFLWYLNTGAWTSTENIDLQYNKTYKIAGNDVITANSLGYAITSAPGITSLGALTSLVAGTTQIDNSGIGSVPAAPLILGTANSTSVSMNGKQITNMAPPTVSDPANTGATKGYVDSAVSVARSGQFAPTIDVTGQATSISDPNLDIFVIQMLTYMLPPTDPSPYGIAENGRARVLVTKVTTPALNNVSSNYIDFGNAVYVDQAGIQTSAAVVGYSSTIRATTNIPAYVMGVHRAVKQYIVSGGVWVNYNVGTSGSNLVWTDGTW
jgi:hypothetical protein